MDEARKNAYRRLLYRAMLDSRMFGGHALDDNYWFKPWLWTRSKRRLAEIQWISDWLHNLAAFAADFEGFDEGQFWKQRDWIGRASPRTMPLIEAYIREFENDWVPSENKQVKVRSIEVTQVFGT